MNAVPTSLIVLCAFIVAGLPAAAATREWRFQVSADGRPIGTHTFKVSDEGGTRSVESSANFRAKVLLLPVYRYDHHDREVWKDGCLQQIEADTDDNGKRLQVQGHAVQDGFRLAAPQPGALLAGCIHTFAYWDADFLHQSRLLNSQSGEYAAVDIAHAEPERIKVRDREVDAEHYCVKNAKFSIDLWYSHEGEWLRLESTTEDGHRLRYELQ